MADATDEPLVSSFSSSFSPGASADTDIGTTASCMTGIMGLSREDGEWTFGCNWGGRIYAWKDRLLVSNRVCQDSPIHLIAASSRNEVMVAVSACLAMLVVAFLKYGAGSCELVTEGLANVQSDYIPGTDPQA